MKGLVKDEEQVAEKKKHDDVKLLHNYRRGYVIDSTIDIDDTTGHPEILYKRSLTRAEVEKAQQLEGFYPVTKEQEADATEATK